MEQLGLSWSTDKKYVFNCDVHNFAENAEMIFGYKIPHCRDRLLLHKLPILWWSQNLLATLCFKIHLELLTSIF